MSDLRRLAKHSSVYVLGNVLNRLGAFILLPLYTKNLSVSEYGVLEICYSLTAVIGVLVAAGLSHGTLRFYYEYEETSERNSVVTTNYAILLTLCVVFMFSISILSTQLAEHLLGDPGQVIAINLCLAILVFELTAEVPLAYLRAVERSATFVVLALGKLVIQVTVSVYLVAYLRQGVQGVLTANLASSATIWVFLLVTMVRACGSRIDISKIRPVLAYTIPFALSGIVIALRTNLDRYFIKEFVSIGDVGLYGLAVKFSMLLTLVVIEPFTRGYGPFRFSLMQRPEAAETQTQVVHCLFLVCILVGLGIALFTPDILRVMTPSEFHKAAKVVPILLIGVALEGFIYCFQTGLLFRKQTGSIFRISLMTLAASVVLNVSLIPVLGISGAALSFVLSQGAAAWLTNHASQKEFSIRYEFPAIVKVALLGAGFFLFGYVYIPDDVVTGVPLKIALLIVFVFCSWKIDDMVGYLLTVTKNIVMGYVGAKH